MRATLESIEKNQAKIHVEVEEEAVARALDQAYRKVVKRAVIPGFRKGKTPRPILEARLGKEVLYEEALEILLSDAYKKAIQETAIEPINQPEIDVVQLEEGKPFIFDATVEVLPEVKLGEYKGVSAVIPEVKVDDEEVDAHLKLLQQRHAKIVDAGDKEVNDGDIAVVDLEVTVDGNVEERLSGSERYVEVGTARFIPGLDAHLLGMNVNEEKTFTMNLPSVFQYKDLEGKEAEFKVKVTAVKKKELPELDDEFAKDISDFDTLEELRANIRKNLEDEATRRTNEKMENKLLELIAEDSEVEIPESMIKREAEYLYGLFIQRLAMDGIGEEYYLNATGRSKEEMLAAFDPQARTRIVQDLIIEAVREKEGIDVSEEEVDDRIKEYMSEYNADELGPEAQEEMREYWNKQRDGISLAIAREKTMELIVANARIAEVEALQEGEGAAEESAEN